MIGASAVSQTHAPAWRASSRSGAAGGRWLSSRHHGPHSLSAHQKHRQMRRNWYYSMTRARPRRRITEITGIFDQPHARFGVSDELNTGTAQCVCDFPTSMRLVTANGNGDGLLPIGDGIGIQTRSTGKFILRLAEQAAPRPDLAAQDNAAVDFAQAATLATCGTGASMTRMPR